MGKPNVRLKMALEYLGLTNLAMAKALDFDPSLISRYLSGQRRLLAASPQMDAIADFLLERSKRLRDVEWLKEQFTSAGLPTDTSTVYQLKQNLIMWLATDGETLCKNLGRTPSGDIAGDPSRQISSQPTAQIENDVKIGNLQIVLALRVMLETLPEGASVRVFLSSDRIAMATDQDFSGTLMETAVRKKLSVSMLVCVSGDTRSIHKLLDIYIAGLIAGYVRLSVVHGITQAITGTMHILADKTCLLVNETFGQAAPPIGALMRDESFARESGDNFDSTARYAQPVLRIYGDECTREVIELLAMEYCEPGPLDVIKDSVNPMFLSRNAYDRFLRTRGHDEAGFAWRSAEFARFKAGMDECIRGGSEFREIISLARLNDIVLRGSCPMAGLYFAEQGYLDLDRQGCIDVLNGYIECLANDPAFSLLILDSLPELHGNNCWHIKRGSHVSVNNWQGGEPVMICSDQLMLLREFQTRYDELWARGAGAIGSRVNVLNILKDAVERMSKKIDGNQSFKEGMS